METELYHFGPTAQLLLLGACIAAVPLAWLMWRMRGQGLGALVQKLTWLALFMTFDLILLGAYTRLSDSGLGCPDWPGCYGFASPIGAQQQIQSAQDALPSGPVTHSKAWIEMLHRYLATGVGGLILVLCFLAWRRHWRRDSNANAGWATVTLLWVCLQGALGAWSVTMKLFPAVVTLHLLGGVLLLALLARQATHPLDRALIQTEPPRNKPIGNRIRLYLGGGLCLLLLQIALGGWVSSNYAVLICDTFPRCQGSYWPDMDFSQGFELWRPLGYTADGQLVGNQALTAIHYSHRLMAYILVPVLAALAWQLHRHGQIWQARALAAGLLLQCLTGISNVVLGWPLLAALLHTGGAAAMVLLLVLALTSVSVFTLPEQATQPAPASGMPARWRQFQALTKPRVIQLIVFCALIGMVLAVPGIPDWGHIRLAVWACLGIWLVAAAAAAFNCIVEQKIDARMQRTAWRPTARGQLSDHQTILFAALLCASGSALLYWAVNPLTMWLTLATFVGYAVIYTLILKPLTPQNIVIGGASGAMPPVLGWAAMTGQVGPEALILCLIIFLWTPPHFWALALYRVEDYRRAGLPMLPVTHGNEFTRFQILLYTWVLLAACLMPFIYQMSGWFYLVSALGLSLMFCYHAWGLWRSYSEQKARQTFRFSLIHLSLLFAALLIDHYI